MDGRDDVVGCWSSVDLSVLSSSSSSSVVSGSILGFLKYLIKDICFDMLASCVFNISLFH